jgi:HSP20 family protein
MERLLDSAVTGTSTLQPATLGMALDVAESENEYMVKASLPGIDLNDLEITYTNNTLTIKGEVREEQELEEARYHLRERSYGSFARSITLPAGVESDKIEANYEAGVLTLRLPKAEEIKPKGRVSRQALRSWGCGASLEAIAVASESYQPTV